MTPEAAAVAETLPAPTKSANNAGDPCTIVIFGASGDLAARKLIPALYEIASQKAHPRHFAVIGFARTPKSDDAFREVAADAVRKSNSGSSKPDDDAVRHFAQSFAYVAGEYDKPEAFQKLASRIEELDKEFNLGGNRLFYLATPPNVYPLVIEQLKKANLQSNPNGKSWVRIIIEKPFGRDLASARALNQAVLDVFEEPQVYRIDHYLGKDTVQNLMALRFANGIFEPLWNRNYVDHVQITAAESLGVEQRGGFYETTGVTRDMIQSHVLQLTNIVALEPPSAFDATAVRNEKLKILQSIRPFTPEIVARDVVRGQYGPGVVEDEPVAGYREEHGVSPTSTTETFVAMKLAIDNWRWAGVPFYLRTGKRMARRVTEIAIQFRCAPHLVFRGEKVGPNLLVLNIQPEEGISISFNAKLPGQEMHLKQVKMDFSYQGEFGAEERSAYATLINDCIRGDATLFDRADSVEAAWALVDPIIDSWTGTKVSFPNYAAGTWGPRESEELLERDGRKWRKP
jgi:glucose-6-phosphate 1-dehydrogenase